MTAAELNLVIKAKDQSAKTFTAIKGRLNKFKTQVNKVAGGFKTLSKKFGTAMSSIARKAKWVALVTVAALTAMVVGSIRQFTKLESGLLDVQKTTGMTDEAIQKLRKSLENLVLVTRGMTMEGLLNASAIAGQLGIRGVKDIGIFSKAVEMMAIATRYTAEEAALDLAKIAKVMDLPISQSEKLGDVMNELSNRTTAFATQVGEITKRAGSMGKSFGLTIPEMMGFAATMIDVGKTSQIGATAITRLLNQALLDTRGFARVSGMEFTKYARLVKDKPMVAIKKFLEGLGKLNKFKKMEVLKELQLSGVRVAPALVAMSENTKLLSDNILIANNQWKTGGSLMKEYTNRARGLSSAFISIWEAVKIMASRLGDVFAPALKAFGTKFQKQMKAVKEYVDNSGIVKAFQDMFGDVMGSMTKHMNILGWIKRVFGETPKEVQANLEKWKTKFLGFRKWLETNSPLEPIKEAFKSILKYAKWVGLAIGLLALATNKWLSTLTLVLIAFEAIQKIKSWGAITKMQKAYSRAEDSLKSMKQMEKELAERWTGTYMEESYKKQIKNAKKVYEEYTKIGDEFASKIYGGKAQTPASDLLRKTYLGVDEGTKDGGIINYFKDLNAKFDALGKGELAKTKIADGAKTAKQASEAQEKAVEATNKSLKERIDIYAKLKKARVPMETGRFIVGDIGDTGAKHEGVHTKESGVMSGAAFDKLVADRKAKNDALKETAAFVEDKFKDQKVSDDELNAAFDKHFKALMKNQNETVNTNSKIVAALVGVDNNTNQNSNALKQMGTKVASLIKKISAVELQNKQLIGQAAG